MQQQRPSTNKNNKQIKLKTKTKIKLPYDPTIPILGMDTENPIIQKDTCTSVFIEALFTIAKTWKQPKCPSPEEWT